MAARNVYIPNAGSGDIGVPFLPLRNQVPGLPFAIVVGDRRESPKPESIGNLFHLSPSSHDLHYLLKFDWPTDTVVLGDKILCWGNHAIHRSKMNDRNLFVIGTPIINIAAFQVNKHALFNFQLNKEVEKEIEKWQSRFKGYDLNDKRFTSWYEKKKEDLSARYPSQILNINYADPYIGKGKCHPGGTQIKCGLITFASHINPKRDDLFSLIIAGIDLTATLTMMKYFIDPEKCRDLDLEKHPFGGLVSFVTRPGKFYETPFIAEIKEWLTDEYTPEKAIKATAGNKRLQRTLKNIHKRNINLKRLREFFFKGNVPV